MKKIILLISLLSATLAFTACAKDKKAAQEPKIVTVLTYSEYIDPAMIKDFEQRTGYKLQLELYEAQEEMIAKLNASGTGLYDVIIGSDVVVQQMIHLGLVGKIDSTQIPNRVNVMPKFRNPAFDPKNDYTWPYLWGTTGIVYNDTTLSPDSLNYSMLFDSTKTKGKFSLLDESRSMLSMALMAKGFDANSKNADQINQAAQLLLAAKKDPEFIGFDGSVAGKDKMLSGMDWAAVVFNGEAMAAIKENPKLRFGIPREGSFAWVDVMMLSSKAPNVKGAYAFMNYILDAKIGAQLANYIAFCSPNQASLPYIDKKMLADPVIYPDSATMNRLVFLADPQEASRLYDEAWTMVKTR